MKQCLVAVDLSEISDAVVEQAARLAAEGDMKLWLVHVVPPVANNLPFNIDRSTLREQAANELRERRGKLQRLAGNLRRRGMLVTTRLLTGVVNARILAEVRRVNADLVIMGTHGHGNFYHAMFGGASQKVLRKAACPVMLVQKQAEDNQCRWYIPGGP